MKCPFCHHDELKVIDSREAPEMNAVKRRRECLKCTKRFTTFETIELSMQVQKRDGRYEEFQKKKLVDGLKAACQHTTVSLEQVHTLTEQIIGELMERNLREISAKELGEIVMKTLQPKDPIAYIRFACVYRRFKNVAELKDAIEAIHPKDDVVV
jgi:transcriptional repressor NrdR